MSYMYHVKTDGFRGELFLPEEDQYPGKALICFSGSDGGIALARMLAGIFQVRGLTTLALAFVMEEGLPQRFARVPIDFLAAAARQIMARLEEHRFPYFYQHLSYDHGSHLFVPMELRSTKFFRGDRGKNKAPGREDRMDSRRHWSLFPGGKAALIKKFPSCIRFDCPI